MKGKLKYGVVLMLLSSFCTCIGQLAWKLSATKQNSLVFIIIGFGLYGVGALLMMTAFHFGELSILHPMLSFGFILSIFIGHFVLSESITLNKILGIALIIIGMIFLSCTKDKEEMKIEHHT